MDHLSSCYFCGTAADERLQQYRVVPAELRDSDDGPTATLCSSCHAKLERLLGPVTEAAGADGATLDAPDTHRRPGDAGHDDPTGDDDRAETTAGGEPTDDAGGLADVETTLVDVEDTLGEGDESADHEQTVRVTHTETAGEGAEERDGADPEEGESEADPEEGESEADPEEGELEADPEEGEEDAEPDQGKEDADPEEGKVDADPEEREEDAEPEEGKADADPEEGESEADPEEGELEADPEEGEEDAEPDQGKEDADPEEGKVDADPEEREEDAEPDQGEADADPDEGEADADPEEGEEDAEPDQGEGRDSGGGDGGETTQTTVSALEYNKVMRLLQNRDFPVDRAEIQTVAANAYGLAEHECAAVIDLAIERGLIGEQDGHLVRPE